MEDLPFGLASKDTYAALTPGDLESMGKQAAKMYLSGQTKLNDAIIKLAGEHPSISPHQVQRVIEFANTETFNQMFEKQADDKNIEFDVADPTVILKQMDIGARGHSMEPQHDDYASAPVKTAGVSEVEADLELMHVFGIDPASPNSEGTVLSLIKTAEDGSVVSVANRVLNKQAESSQEDDAAHRILTASTEQAPIDAKQQSNREESQKVAFGPAPSQLMAGNDVESTEESHHREMLDISRSIELEKKKQELAAIQQKTQESLMGPPAGQDPMMGGGPEAAGAGAGAGAAAPMPQGGGGQPTAAPAVAPSVPSPQKMASDLTKTAMAVAKSSSSMATQVLEDLKKATSMDRVKEALAHRPEYPQANPYGELIRTRQKVEKLACDSRDACDKNARLIKEASGLFCHAVGQHLLEGGRFGEVVHALDSTGASEEAIKLAMIDAIDYLKAKGIVGNDLQVDQIKYAMAAKEHRIINPASPVVQSFATLVKLAQGQATLNHARDEMTEAYVTVERTLQEALVRGSIAS